MLQIRLKTNMQKENEIANNNKTINLYNMLVRDQKSIFYASDRITNGLIRKANNSLYLKDKVFVKLLKDLDRKKVFINEKTPLNTPFVEKSKMLTVQHFTVLKVLLNRCRRTLLAFDSWVSQQSIQSIVFCLLICLLL